ncbi:putative Subtilisin-like serine protease [Bradyrhizobium sp. ORS 278]|uniref:S8 family peptidase n=1 Tax=Bradyrhizobium sp. (strain ORS 278) TaxID=114615 RepID=UPI0001507864|nr:S8 family serine peptidase [Bradyrhizobium sp. ORS 278]CAL74729.1 putative Subtilisin-like serine protease [Bradyrhizobium sp. ORS 278]
MAKSEYIILRRIPLGEISSRSNELVDAHAISNKAQSARPPSRLTVAELDERDAGDLRRDPEVLLAPAVPLSLIRPLIASEDSDEKTLDAARAAGISWGVHEVAPTAALDDGAATTVAILDTGIDASHAAFKGVDLRRENFSNSSNDGDANGHGTHCAGTIFGRDVDGVRIGIARGVRKALIGKVLNDEGRGDTAIFARATQWALDNGARVISMSLGFDFNALFEDLKAKGNPRAQAFSMALSHYRDTVRLFDSIIQTLNASGIVLRTGAVVVAAAGNESQRRETPPCIVDVSLPAAAEGVVSVGAVEKSTNGFEVASFSNANAKLWAPGVGIVSARVGGGLAVSQGTSMAAPHVSGAAVLWSEWLARRNPRSGPAELKARLTASARVTGFSPTVADAERGSGLIQAPPGP